MNQKNLNYEIETVYDDLVWAVQQSYESKESQLWDWNSGKNEEGRGPR